MKFSRFWEVGDLLETAIYQKARKINAYGLLLTECEGFEPSIQV